MPNDVQIRNAQAVDRILPNLDDDMKRRNITLRQMCHVNEMVRAIALSVLRLIQKG